MANNLPSSVLLKGTQFGTTDHAELDTSSFLTLKKVHLNLKSKPALIFTVFSLSAIIY